MEKELKSLRKLVKANPNKILRGSFSSTGPHVNEGGWYDVFVNIDGEEYRGNVYSFIDSIDWGTSALSRKLVFGGRDPDSWQVGGFGFNPPEYTDDEFLRKYGVSKEEANVVRGYADSPYKGDIPSRKYQGEMIVTPMFGKIDRDELEKIERELSGFDEEEICRRIRNKEIKLSDLRKLKWAGFKI